MISEVHSDKVARLATVRRSWRDICRKKLTERHSWTDIFRLRIERTEICRKSKRTRVNKWKSEAKSACGRDDWAARKRSDSNLLDSTRNRPRCSSFTQSGRPVVSHSLAQLFVLIQFVVYMKQTSHFLPY